MYGANVMDLLNALQTAGDAIDKTTGGRAVRGLLNGKPRELLSPIPFSDSIGLTSHKDATSGRDLTDSYGLTSKGDNSFGSHAAGFLADNVLSPANMLGAYGAFKAAPTIAKGVTSGAKALSGLDLVDHLAGAGVATAKGVAGAGRSVGNLLSNEAGYLKVPLKGIPSELADAADALGPMHPGGIDKLMRMADSVHEIRNPGMPSVPRSDLSDARKLSYLVPYDRIMNLANSEHANKIAMEIPGGSKYLGSGTEALAFRTPAGDVVRVADHPFNGAGRQNIQEVLQPYRHAQVGPYTVEHLPFVGPTTGSLSEQLGLAEAMKSRLRSQQYDPWDVGFRNMGVTGDGNHVIHDAGAVLDPIGHSARGVSNPYRRIDAPSDELVAKLIEMGAPEAVRNSMSSASKLGSSGQGVAPGDLLSALRNASVGQ
jgi:hypothetical protein